MSAAFTLANVGREWRACQAIAMQAYHKRRGQGSSWLSKALWVLALLGSVIAGKWTGKWAASFGIGLGIGSALFSFLWWSLLLASVTQQNFPVAYYLVPGMRRRSLMVLAGIAFLIIVVHALLFAMAGVAPAFAAAIALAALATVAAAMLLRSVQLLLSCWTVGYVLFGLQTPPALDRWAESHYLIATAVLLLAYALLAKLEWRGRGRGARVIGATPRLTQKAVGLYGWRLRRDCEKANIGYLLLHACGPGGFASMEAPGLLFVFICAAIAQPFLDDHSVWMIITKGFVVLFTIGDHLRVARKASATMSKPQSSQSLVRLSAGAPDARLFNRSLGRALLREYGLYWGATSGGVLLFMAAAGMDGGSLLGLGAVYVLNLMFAAFLFRNFSQRNPEQGRTKLLLMCYTAAAAVLAWFVLRGGVGIGAALTLLLGAALAATCVLVFRTRAFARLPVAFPAARR